MKPSPIFSLWMNSRWESEGFSLLIVPVHPQQSQTSQLCLNSIIINGRANWGGELGVWRRMGLDASCSAHHFSQRLEESLRGFRGAGIHNVFGPAVQGAENMRRKKNKQKRRERTGRGGETQGNMSWILSTGYRICCIWRPLVGSREIYDSSLVPGQFRTSTGIFLLFMWRGTKVVKVQNRRHKSAYTATVTQPERGLELGRSRARRLMAAASERRFKLAGAHTWPPRQNGNQKGDYHLHLQHVTDLTWERERERRWTQIPSPLQKQPFSCCGSYELCYREEKLKKIWKRERMEGKGERVSGERGNPKRFIPFLFSLRVAFPLCLVPLLLNLTIKQHCKNRMFLAGAQQWQSGEGRRTIH